MHNRIFLVIVIILAFGFLDTTLKLSSTKISPFVLIPSLFITAILLSLPFALKEKGPQPITKRDIFKYPLIAGVCYSISATAYNLAMGKVPVTILSPVGSTCIMISIILSIIFLRERPTRLQYLGIPSVIGGVIVLANPSIGIPTETSLDLSSYVLIIITLIFGGLMLHFSRMSVNIFGPCRFLTLSTSFAFIVSIFFLPSQSSIELPIEHLIYIIIGGSLVIIARITLFTAMKEMPMTLFMPMVSLAPTIPMAFGIIFLGESLSMIQGIGAAFALLGIMMLNR